MWRQDTGGASLQAEANAGEGEMSEPWRLLYRATDSGEQGAVCAEWPAAECTRISANCRHLRLDNG